MIIKQNSSKMIIVASLVCFFFGSPITFSQTQWVGTWVNAQQLTEPNNNPPSPGLANNTLRQVVRVTLSGNQIWLLLLTAAILYLFLKARLCVCWSDTLSYNLAALSTCAISIYFGSAPSDVTGHPGSRTTSYLQSGNVVTNPSLSGSTTDHWYILTGIDVSTDGTCAAMVTLGDSITDGRGSTTNQNNRWPPPGRSRKSSSDRSKHE